MFGLGDFDIKTTRIYEEATIGLIMRQLRRRIGNVNQQLARAYQTVIHRTARKYC